MELVQMAREAGAKKVFFASAAPPVRFSNVYGIDIPTRTELIAHNRTEAEIAAVLGCDGVIYNDLEDIVEAVKSCNPTAIKDFDTSCFSGIRSFIFPVVMSILDYVCVFKRETIQRVDFVTHML
jgi:amidophosphoribosyltransferase